MIGSRLILLRTRNVSDKSCVENQNTQFMFYDFSPINRAVYETMWKIMIKPERPQITIKSSAALCAMDI